LASLIEKMGMEAEIKCGKVASRVGKCFAVSPWYKSNALKCEEIGLKIDEFLQLCLNSIKKEKCR
jgi:hypothetical protein